MDEIISWIALKIDAVIQAVINFFIWLLDLLKDINLYANPTKSASAIKKYIIDEKFTKKQLDTYLKDYPDKIYRIMYQLDLFDVFI